MYFGHRGYHKHHTLDPDMAREGRDEAITEVARDVLQFIRALVGDEIVFRWGLVSGTRRRTSGRTVNGTRMASSNAVGAGGRVVRCNEVKGGVAQQGDAADAARAVLIRCAYSTGHLHWVTLRS